MRKEQISEVIGQMEERHIKEALSYTSVKKRKPFYKTSFGRGMVAAAMLLIVVLAGKLINSPKSSTTITAYAYGSNQEIKCVHTNLSTGRVNSDGSMTGIPLSFYLTGPEIKTVRFSVKNQWIDFKDWTEKREEFGVSKNFTISYGEPKSDYVSLVFTWEPNELWKALEKKTSIDELEKELREDVIVLEITYMDGKMETKAVNLCLQENGEFSASFTDYTITEEDTFVKRGDSEAVEKEILNSSPSEKVQEPETLSKDEIEKAKEQAAAYYKGTVFEVISMKQASYDGTDLVFRVLVKKDGKIQDPERTITLSKEKDGWTVINEGY